MNEILELAERTMLLSLARDGDTFFDIGANVGVYSTAFAKRFPSSMVYAFEPIPATSAKLYDNLIMDGLRNIFVCPYGLSDVDSIAEFYISPVDSGATSMAPLESERFGQTDCIAVSVMTLDRFSGPPRWIYPNIIKCDVEGAELLVFRGAAGTLESYHPIIQCEMLRKWAKRFNYHPNDLISYLTKFGYKCYTIRDGRLVLFPTMDDETVDKNFYFLTEEHKERML